MKDLHLVKYVRIRSYILFLFLISSFVILLVSPASSDQSYTLESTINSVEFVRITVVIDNNANGSLKAPWGVSMLVETPYNKILFDTGPNKYDLEANAQSLGVSIDDIDFIVISHEHGDHVDGLGYYDNRTNSQINPNLEVYIPSGMSYGTKTTIEFLGLVLNEINSTTILGNGLSIIGQLYGPPYEHALAVNVTGVGLVILVGCSHPGVTNIVKKAVEDLNTTPYAVLGGFHESMSSEQEIITLIESLQNLSLSQIYPFHCSGDLIRSYLQSNHPEMYREVCVGSTIFFSEDTISLSTTETTDFFFPLIWLSAFIILLARKGKLKTVS